MSNIIGRAWFKAIAIFLVIAFVTFDVAWAGRLTASDNDSCLAVPTLFKNLDKIESARGVGGVLYLSLQVADYAYGDPNRGIEKLPINLMDEVLTGSQIGANRQLMDGADLSLVTLLDKDGKKVDLVNDRNLAEDDDTILICYTRKDHKYILQVALRNSPSPSKLIGHEYKGLSDRYVLKIVRDDDVLDAAVPVKAKSWIDQNLPVLSGKTVVSLSMEGNIPEFKGFAARDANTKGGLGAYFGDKLEGMASIGINAIGMQPGYSHIMVNGKPEKVKDYKDLIEEGILVPVLIGKDAIKVRAWGDTANESNPEIAVEVYKVNRGGATDYILMSKALDVLYTDDRLNRFIQEIVFGKAAYEAIKRLELKPDILHLNEAHTVVAAAQLRADKSFDSTRIVYTNHTIVPAGLETFFASSLKTDIPRMMFAIGLTGRIADKFTGNFLGADGTVDFCFIACKLADVINGVSKEHAVETKKLFKNIYGQDFNIEVVGVLNGSGKTWKSDRLIDEENASGGEISKDALYDIHESSKLQAFREIEKRTGIVLDPAKPTAFAIRRLVDYKSQYPMARFLVHILTADRTATFTRSSLRDAWFDDIPDLKSDSNRSIVETTLDKIFRKGAISEIHGLGMQMVLGGPEYMPYWVEEFKRWSNMEKFKGKFVYVPSSDAELLKMQAIGADICINMPRPLEEACGTSDQRTGLNGGVNIALAGAGPVEWMEEYDEATGKGSGFFIGSYTNLSAEGTIVADNPKFYHEAPADIFEKCAFVSRLYYEPGQQKWKGLMHNSYVRANEYVSAAAMEKRYALDVYMSALRNKSASDPVSIPSNAEVPSVPSMREQKLAVNGTRWKNPDPKVTELFQIVRDTVNNKRAQIIKDTIRLQLLADIKLGLKDLPGEGEVPYNNMTSAELREKVELTLGIIETAKAQKGQEEIKKLVLDIEANLKHLEADSIMACIIAMAIKAKHDKESFIIGLGKDWIPEYRKRDGSIKESSVNLLIQKIESLDKTLRSMGLDNVIIIHESEGELEDAIIKEKDRTNTKFSNIVVLGAKTALESGSFNRLRSTDTEARAFLAAIDPSELNSYIDSHDMTSEELHIRLMEMLSLALELAMGKEPPQMPIIFSYDQIKRIVTFLPRAEPFSDTEISGRLKAEIMALESV